MLRLWHSLSELPTREKLTIEGSEAFHLSRVRRIRPGERVDVLAGGGCIVKCTYQGPEGRGVRLRVLESVWLKGRRSRLRLAVGILKGGAMDQLIRDVTQLGVDEIIPLYSDHTEVRIDPRRVAEKIHRWQLIAIESCKQCGNPWLPEIAEPVDFKSFIASSDDSGMRCIASLEPGAGLLGDALGPELPDAVTWLVGPEGDFSAGEYAVAAAAGFVPVRLSAHVLRGETAAVYALALAEYELARRGCCRESINFEG